MRGATTITAGRRYPIDVSIHAPVRGATIAVLMHWLKISVSIHAPVRGATRICIFIQSAVFMFQSTHP